MDITHSKAVLKIALKVTKTAVDFAFGEVDRWAKDNNLEARMRKKLRTIRIKARDEIKEMGEQAAEVINEAVAARDAEIERLNAILKSRVRVARDRLNTYAHRINRLVRKGSTTQVDAVEKLLGACSEDIAFMFGEYESDVRLKPLLQQIGYIPVSTPAGDYDVVTTLKLSNLEGYLASKARNVRDEDFHSDFTGFEGEG